MTTVGLLALPLVVGLVVGLVAGPTTGIAAGLGGIIAAVASLIVLTPGRGRHIAAGGAVSDAASGWAEFHRELARSRRFERSFAIVRLSAGEEHADDVLTSVRDRVAATARRTDRAWVDGHDVLVLLPETAPTTAARFTSRILSAIGDVQLQPTMATFPDDGITSGALIAVAYGGAVVPTPIGAVRSDVRPAGSDADTAAVPEASSGGG